MEKFDDQRTVCLVDDKFSVEEQWIVRARKIAVKPEIIQWFLSLFPMPREFQLQRCRSGR